MQIYNLPFYNVKLTGGFYYEKQQLIRQTTLQCVYDRFAETGRIGAFEMKWRDGDPNKPHYFWDSDVAKWMESAAYLLEERRDPELEAKVDSLVDCIEKNRAADGYFNIYFQLFCPEKRFTDRDCHELYCAGHLLEAAIAYDHATGKGKFLSLMKDYMRLIKRVFEDEDSAGFSSPGHEEIEIALIKLYDYTGEDEWLDLAAYFINKRGLGKKPGKDSLHSSYNQDHLPVREQFTAEGHAVRACYFYTAAADLARRTGDKDLEYAMKRVFDNITCKKMYITGAIGSTAAGEAFEGDCVLPLDTAYAETCAALALALFSQRMSALDCDAKYADAVEKIIYNGFLSGLSLDGTSFFYENAQQISLSQRKLDAALGKNTHYPITGRVLVFGCSCCPPNVTRFIASIGGLIYNYGGRSVYVNQYMQSEADVGGVKITQTTDYPYGGKIELNIEGEIKDLALRIPGWRKDFTVKKDGAKLDGDAVNGYFHIFDAKDCTVTLDLSLEPRFNFADENNVFCKNKTAVTYGPFVMCAEGVDNGGALDGVIVTGYRASVETKDVFGKINVLLPAEKEGRPFDLRLVPYYTFANRGQTDMKTWFDII